MPSFTARRHPVRGGIDQSGHERTVALDDATDVGVVDLLAVAVALDECEEGADEAVLDAAEEAVAPDHQRQLWGGVSGGDPGRRGARTVKTS